MRTALDEAFGFQKGQKVRTLVDALGQDHDGIEHTVKAGAVATIEAIEDFGGKQGISFTLAIPVDESGERGIYNVIDQSDGPINNFIETI